MKYFFFQLEIETLPKEKKFIIRVCNREIKEILAAVKREVSQVNLQQHSVKKLPSKSFTFYHLAVTKVWLFSSQH